MGVVRWVLIRSASPQHEGREAKHEGGGEAHCALHARTAEQRQVLRLQARAELHGWLLCVLCDWEERGVSSMHVVAKAWLPVVFVH